MEKIAGSVWKFIEKAAGFVVFKIFHLHISEEKWQGFLQFIKFGIVGVSNTVVSYVIYVISLLLFQKNGWFVKTDYLIAQVIAFVLSVLWSFYWNRKYVFNSEDGEAVSWYKALIKTYISYAFTGLFLNTVLSVLWVQILGISKMIAPIVNLLISVPLNFIMNNFWAFKK